MRSEAMGLVLALLGCCVGALSAVQIATCGLVIWRQRATARSIPVPHPPVTILRPVCGIEPDLRRTLESSFGSSNGDCEILFCVARADDAAIPLIRAVMAAQSHVPARLLIGEDRVSGNPKLNNLVKGWAAARHEWIAMIDSNVLLPPDYIATLFATWRRDTGLVTSPPAGTAPEGFPARVEAAFLDTHQGRFQLASDAMGHGFAQGKVLFWRRDILDAAGGPAALGRDLAEDVAATKLVRAAGLRVRIVPALFPQPLGKRRAGEVWHRQVRWARVRRAGFPVLFAAEILTGIAAPALALAGLIGAGMAPWSAFPAFVALWYGAEWSIAARLGWPRSAADVLAWMLRDLLIPAVWIAALVSRGFAWRGTAMGAVGRATAPPS